MSDDPPDYRLTFRALPGPVSAARRLAGLLKLALRVFGLRCLKVEEVRPEKDQPSTEQERSTP